MAPRMTVPRVVGCSIPQKSSKTPYAEFMLAHFKPFTFVNPLIKICETIEETYQKYCFDNFSCEIVANWEAVHECEDAWDAEHINKRAQMTKASHIIKQTIHSVLDDDWEIDIEKSIKILNIVIHLQLLENSNWFSGSQSHPHIIYAQSTQPSFIPDITSVWWKADIKDQENVISQSRLNILNPDQPEYLMLILSQAMTLKIY